MLCKVDIVRLHKQSVVGARTHREGVEAHRGVKHIPVRVLVLPQQLMPALFCHGVEYFQTCVEKLYIVCREPVKGCVRLSAYLV